MGNPTPRRLAVAAAVAAALLTLSACGSGGDNPTPNGSTESGGGQLGGAPTDSADPTASGTSGSGGGAGGGGSTSGTGGGGNQAPTYPSDARTYGLEILKAISNKDSARLAALADQNTINYSQTQQYQNRNGGWVYADCGSSVGGSTTCHYYNQTGDIALVIMVNAKLGKTQAGTSVLVEGGSYANDAGSYVAAFVDGWTNDNYAKMISRSSASIADHFLSTQKLTTGGSGTTTSQPHPCATNSSKTCVDASSVGGTLNLPTQHFIVDTSKLGKPNAIVGYEPAT